MSLAELLQKGYSEWSAGVGGTQADFAMAMGVNPVMFNRHILGRSEPRPDDPVIDKYAAWFGPVVFDELGLARRDEAAKRLIHLLDEIDPEQQPAFIKLVQEAARALKDENLK